MPLKRQETQAPRSHTRCRHLEQQDRHQALQLGGEGEAREETKAFCLPFRMKVCGPPRGPWTLVKGLAHVTLQGYTQKKINYLSICILGNRIFLTEMQAQWSTGPVALQYSVSMHTPSDSQNYNTRRLKTTKTSHFCLTKPPKWGIPSNGPFCPNRCLKLLPLLQCVTQENLPASPWQRALHCEWKQKSPFKRHNIMCIRQATKERLWVTEVFSPFKSNTTSTETEMTQSSGWEDHQPLLSLQSWLLLPGSTETPSSQRKRWRRNSFNSQEQLSLNKFNREAHKNRLNITDCVGRHEE